MIDDLPAFVLLISMVRSPPILLLPSSHSPPVPFLSYCPLPPALSKLTFSTLQFSPLLTTPSLLCLYLLPLKPSIQSPPPPMFQVSRVGSHQNFNILGGPNWILSCCIHKVKQTIVHMIHMILSRSVHQITYGDVLKAFCKKNLPAKDTSE